MNIDFGDGVDVPLDDDYFDFLNEKALKTRSVTAPTDSVTVKIGKKLVN